MAEKRMPTYLLSPRDVNRFQRIFLRDAFHLPLVHVESDNRMHITFSEETDTDSEGFNWIAQ